MCRAEYIIYACGHAKNHSTDCEVAEQHGALFNRVGCVNYTFASKYAEQHCGTGGFYCSQTQDGRLIDKAYDHFQALKPRLHAIKTELGTNHAALQGYISQAMAINMPLETLNMFALYQALQQQQMTIMRQNNELEQRHKYLQNLLAFAQNNRVQLQAAAASQPAWDGKEFDYTRSIFPEALLKPIQRKSPGRQAIPALSLGSGVEVALRPVQNVPQVQVAAPNTGFDARGYQHQQKRFRQDPTPPTAHRRQASTAPSNFSMEANIPKGNTPPNESTIEKVYRLRAHFAAEQNQKVANAMIRQGYDVENYGIKPPAKTGHRRPHNPGTPPKRKDNGRSATAASNDKSASSAVRRSTRTRNSKPNYVEDPEDSDGLFGSRDMSPDKSDAAYNESPTKSEDSSSPSKSVKAIRGQKKRVPTTESPASRVHSSLTNIVADYRREAKQGGDKAVDTTNMRSAVPSFVGRNFQINSGMTLGGTGEASSVGTPFQYDTRAQYPLVRQSVAPVAPMVPPSYSIPRHNAQAQVSGNILDSSRVSGDAYKGLASSQMGSSSAQQSGYRSFPSSLGIQSSASSMLASLQYPGTSARNATFSHAPQHKTPGLSSHGMSSPYVQPHDSRDIGPQNVFHQKYLQSLSSNAAGSGQAVNNSMPASFAPAPAALNKHDPFVDMPTLNSRFEPSPIMQPDYMGMRRSFSSTASLMPVAVGVGQQVDSNVEPVKPDIPSSMSLSGFNKRPRLSLPGEDGAPTFDRKLPSLQSQGLLDLSSNSPGLGQGETVNENNSPQIMGQLDTETPTSKAEALPSLYQNVQPDINPLGSYNPNDYAWEKLPDSAEQGQGYQAGSFPAENSLQLDTDQTSEPDWGVMMNETQFS